MALIHTNSPAHRNTPRDAEGRVDTESPEYRAAVEGVRRRREARAAAIARPAPKPPASLLRPKRPTVGAPRPAAPVTVSVSAGRAAHGAAGLAKAALNLDPVDAATLAARREACESCPHLKPIKPKVVGVSLPVTYTGCELCGCRYQSKIRNAGESCPIGRWGPVPSPS